jgi:hypothetical protein
MVVVPKTEHMTVATLQRILDLANNGATVFFLDALPTDVPGYGQLSERRTRLNAELARLHLENDPAGGQGARIGAGRVVIAPFSSLLLAAQAMRETMADLGLRFIRRTTAEGYVYFIANQTGQLIEGWVPLGRPAQGAVQLNPRRGGAGVATLRQHNGAAEVYLQLAPGESFFIKTLTARAATGQPASHLHPAGEPVVLDGDWKVTATRGGPELPPAFSQHGFGSWTAQGGEWERFGGTARYETEFTLPADAKADDWLLDLGDVRETARVFVNGTETDLVWSLPMRTKIGSFLKPGKNTLALEVTNLPANRIRDLDQRKVEWKKFHEINFVNIFYRRFDAAGWPLQPSGLLGPVKLVPLQAFTP